MKEILPSDALETRSTLSVISLFYIIKNDSMINPGVTMEFKEKRRLSNVEL